MTLLTVKRACYGDKKTPVKDREYHLIGSSHFPVGTVDEWIAWAKPRGYNEIRTVELDGKTKTKKFKE